MKRGLLILSVTLLTLAGCKKEDRGEGDMQMPIIKMSAPDNNQVFSAGQTASITASITDNKQIEEVHLEIVNTTTGVFLTHEHYAPKTANYTLSRTFTTQAGAAYKIKVLAEDAAGNIGKTETNITSN